MRWRAPSVFDEGTSAPFATSRAPSLAAVKDRYTDAILVSRIEAARLLSISVPEIDRLRCRRRPCRPTQGPQTVLPRGRAAALRRHTGRRRINVRKMSARHFRLGTVNDLADIDTELRLLAAIRRSVREQGVEPSIRQVDELLDERGLRSGVQ
jgi:hypothetical protein